MLRGAGFDEIPVLEIAVSRDWIPGAFSPHYLVGGATLEIFELSGPPAVEDALDNLAARGDDVALAQNETIWGAGSLIVILLNAGSHPDIERSIVALIGPPALTTSVEPPPPATGVDAPGTVSDLLALLEAAGLENIAVATTLMPVTREWIPVAAASLLLVGGAQLEVYELGSATAAAAALESFQDGSEFTPPPNATIWGPGSLILILLGAPEHPETEAAISDAVGSPVIATITGSPLPPPPTGGPGEGPPLVATSVEALADALRSAGLDVLVTDTVVRQPWIPAGGVHLVVDGAGVDVFVLSSQDAVSEATATRKNGPPIVQPSGDVEVWLNGTAFIILLDAPQHSAVSDAISALIGHPQFSTITVSLPPPPPEALPNTGSGGLGDATNVSARVWLFVAGSFFLVAVLGYAVTSGGRGRLRSP